MVAAVVVAVVVAEVRKSPRVLEMARVIPSILIALAALSANAPAAAAVTAPETAPVVETDAVLTPYRQELANAASVAFKPNHTAEEWKQADKALAKALADPRFGQLLKSEQALAFSGAGWAAIQLSDYPRARDLFAQATERDSGNGHDWLLLARLEANLGNHDAAARVLTDTLKRWPELLSEAEVVIFQVVDEAEAGSPARLELLQLLFDKQWKSTDRRASRPWYQLALERIRRGEPDAARAAIVRIGMPETLVRVRSDKRFDGLFDPDAPQFDPVAAANRVADEWNVQAILKSSSLQVLADLVRAMLAVGMNEPVLDISDRIVRTIDEGPGVSPYSDPDQLVWILSNRATALRRVGKIGESVALMEKVASMTVDGRRNVNQALDLGNLYCGLGRGEDAFSAAAKAGEMSGYGRMVQALVQHCGAVLTGDQRAAANAMDYLREHRSDSESLYLVALLRTNQLEEAAKTVIERLESEYRRGDMLFDVQDFLEPKPLPANVELEARWKAMLARDDVKQAIARVGRIEHYDYFGN